MNNIQSRLIGCGFHRNKQQIHFKDIQKALLICSGALFIINSLIYSDVHQMGYGRYSLFLHHGSGAEQSACRNKEDVAVSALYHRTQYMTAQYRSTAPAPRAARVNVLILTEDQNTAVIVPRAEIYALLEKQISQKPCADPSQIACEYHIVIIRLGTAVAQKAVYGVRRSRC